MDTPTPLITPPNRNRPANHTDDEHRARILCLRYFYGIQFGIARFRRSGNRQVRVGQSEASGSRRLGYPSYTQLKYARNVVNATCPDETAAYRDTFRDFCEALTRYRATESMAAWKWYTVGEGNRSSVYYYTTQVNRRTNKPRDRRIKYLANELLPPHKERLRAWREMQEADAEMVRLRDLIFARMGVPVPLRQII